MKRIISILILIILLFFIFQWGFVFLKKEHEISYKVFVENETFDIHEIYKKEYGDKYDIVIKNGNNTYSYLIDNKYNKQKKIIKEIKYYNEDDNYCIYPILESEEGTYIVCAKDGKIYTDTSFPDQNFISKIKEDLILEGYPILTQSVDTSKTNIVGKTTFYTDALNEEDIINVWNYKGIDIIKSNNPVGIISLNFDKYENNHGYLVGKYYIVPNYLSSKVSEFSSVDIIDVESGKTEKLKLNYTLSSNTYINGVIDQKLYYTDPSNLLQIEINPVKKQVRLIGSKEIGGQLYQGKWKNVNIYDFVTSKLLFNEEIPNEINEKYSYQQIIESNMNYYFYNNSGEVYRVSKNHLDEPILLFQMSSLNNFKVVENTVYFVVADTLYYFEEGNGVVSVLKNNELRYNTTNRIDVYRKS